MNSILTARFQLIPATLALSEAELTDRQVFSSLLSATVPAEWPPETSVDAFPFFSKSLRANPDWIGWLAWYAVLVENKQRVLVGSVGFLGPAIDEGMVETGYSVLPQFQGKGFATEMVAAIVLWAFQHPAVTYVEAETAHDNIASSRVLEKNGFRPVGGGKEAGHIRFRLTGETAIAKTNEGDSNNAK